MNLGWDPAGVIAGAMLLIAGRKLFWLFVAGAGFILGAGAASAMFPEQPQAILLAGVILGVVGAIVAVVVKKFAIRIAGIVLGAYVGYQIPILLGYNVEMWIWVTAVVGGAIGALTVTTIFDSALILLSALSGATLLVSSTVPNESWSPFAALGLAIFGAALQAGAFRGKKREKE
jgi:hypothetical protein